MKPAFGFDSNVATEDVGCVLVLAGFGRAGARLAFLNLGNGLRKVNASRGKDELRDAGEPVDFAFVGATPTFSLAPDAEKASRDGKDRHEEGAEDFANVSLDLAGSAAKEKKQCVGVAALTRVAPTSGARTRRRRARRRARAQRRGGLRVRSGGFVRSRAVRRIAHAAVRARAVRPVVGSRDSRLRVPGSSLVRVGGRRGLRAVPAVARDAVAATARAVSAMETRN